MLATSQRCESCNEKVSLHQAPLLDDDEASAPTSLIARESTLAARARSSAADPIFSVDELRYGRPLEVSSSLAQLLGLRPDEVEQLRAEGESAILAEFEAEAGAPSAWRREEMGEHGWSELEWCLYLSASKAEASGKAADDEEKARAERSASLRQQARETGAIDAGRKDCTIDYFLKRPEMVAAGLTRGQVLALRLIASPVAAKINRALRNGCDAGRPHPYPATVISLCDGLLRLWSGQLEQRLAASKAAAAAAERGRVARLGGDEEAIAAADGAAKQAAADSEALKIGALWQGVCGLSSDVLKERGGTEVGFHFSCSGREAAQAQAVQQLRALQASQAAAPPEATGGSGDEQAGRGKEQGGESAGEGAGDKAPGGEDGDGGGSGEGPADGLEHVGGAPPPPTAAEESPAQAAASSPDGPAQAASAVDTGERPMLLLRIDPSLNLASAVNLSSLSPTSADVYCLPPGAYLEQRKVAVEAVPVGDQGEPLEVKVVNVVLHLPPLLAKHAAVLADARAEGKAAREKAQ